MGMEGSYIRRAMRLAPPNVLMYFKNEILFRGSCAECVNYCM